MGGWIQATRKGLFSTLARFNLPQLITANAPPWDSAPARGGVWLRSGVAVWGRDAGAPPPTGVPLQL